MNATQHSSDLHNAPNSPRTVGAYVRIVGGLYFDDIGCIFDDCGDAVNTRRYKVGLWHAGGEDYFSADEIIAWTPRKGDRVVEICVDEDYGTVLSSANGSTTVKWDYCNEPQDWRDDEIEPAETFVLTTI